MATADPQSADPFVDPNPGQDEAAQEEAFHTDATLAVERNGSLTLGTDALIVLDEALENSSRDCCGMWPSGSTSTRAIPFYNILWVDVVDNNITIYYAKSIAKSIVRASTLTYQVENYSLLTPWVSKLLDRAYGVSQRSKRALVLVNPHSGQGKAQKWYHRDIEPILVAAHCKITMKNTKYSGEAIEIAEKMDIDEYDMVVSCSGDGLPYEVFNGLGKRPDAKRALSKIAVVQIPCGSGNAMSCNLNGTDSPSLASLAVVKGVPTPLDLISITQGETRTLSFLSQSVGIIAESDLATENLRWMGSVRFTYGFLVRLLGKTVYPCDIAVKVAIGDKNAIKEHYRAELGNTRATVNERRGTLDDDDASASSGNEEGLPALVYGTINDKLPDDWEMTSYDNLGNFYCGNMAYMSTDANFFSPALPNDGYMDLVCINGDISRFSALQMMTAVGNGKFFEMPLVSYRKVMGYRITPKSPGDGYISVDGERIPFKPFQAEVHRGLGTVLTKSGHMYEAPGPF